MQRQPLDNGTWFDLERAKSWEDHEEFDGRNMISAVTGSQWEHQRLWRSAGGTWVVQAWSDWQGSSETWEVIDDQAAAQWLVINKHDSDFPDDFFAQGEV